MEFYDCSAKKINGQEVSMSDYKGKVVVVVNTASKCGFTPQFEGLELLYKKYKDEGLVILGFPCNQFAKQEPGGNQEIHEFCQLNYGVSFEMFEKINVNGDQAHPIYKVLKSGSKGVLNSEIKWNFTKFLIDREGNIVRRYVPIAKPMAMEEDIKKLLSK